MARRPYITPSDIPTARKSRCLSFPDSLEWEALINGFLAMGTRLENWQQLPGGIAPEDAVAACVELLNDFFEAGECFDMTPIGGITMFGSNTPPEKWLICDGSAISRETYAELFAVIGVTYGVGNETTTFNLPDFKDRSPMMPGVGNVDALGVEYGLDAVALTLGQLPNHDHDYDDPGHTHVLQSPFTSIIGARPTGGAAAAAGSTISGGAQLTTNETGITFHAQGSNQSHNNTHPVLGVNFIIFTGIL